MAITRAQKEQILSQLQANFKQAKSFALSTYQGLTVKELADFRGKLGAAGASYQVAKKTLIKKAAQDAGYQIKDEQLVGAVGVAFSFTDELAAIRVSHQFSVKHDKLQPLGGALGNEELTIEALRQLATLPSRTQLLGKLVGALKSPLFGFTYVIAGPFRGFQSIIGQLHKQKAS